MPQYQKDFAAPEAVVRQAIAVAVGDPDRAFMQLVAVAGDEVDIPVRFRLRSGEVPLPEEHRMRTYRAATTVVADAALTSRLHRKLRDGDERRIAERVSARLGEVGEEVQRLLPNGTPTEYELTLPLGYDRGFRTAMDLDLTAGTLPFTVDGRSLLRRGDWTRIGTLDIDASNWRRGIDPEALTFTVSARVHLDAATSAEAGAVARAVRLWYLGRPATPGL